MGQLVFLIVPRCDIDEYAEVVSAGGDSNRSSSKFCANLIKASRKDTFLRAVDVEGRYGGVVRGLLGQIGYNRPFRYARLI